MVPNIEYDYIFLLGYSILYKEDNLTGFNHQKNATHMRWLKEAVGSHVSQRRCSQHLRAQ